MAVDLPRRGGVARGGAEKPDFDPPIPPGGTPGGGVSRRGGIFLKSGTVRGVLDPPPVKGVVLGVKKPTEMTPLFRPPPGGKPGQESTTP